MSGSRSPMPDASDVPAFDEGSGPVILIVHPGFDDGTSWARVAAHLSRRFRVIRPVRRQYRAADKEAGPVSIADEVREILAIAEAVGERMVIVGHSSGGIVALETLVAATSPLFAGAVVYEPPLVIGPPLGGTALHRARAALAAGKPGKAMQIFGRDIAAMPPAMAWVTRAIVALRSGYRRLVVHQFDDVRAIDDLGLRLDAYRGIGIPVVVVQGDRTPAAIVERSDALRRVLPDARQVVLRGQGHAAHLRAPDRLAAVIAELADEVLSDA